MHPKILDFVKSCSYEFYSQEEMVFENTSLNDECLVIHNPYDHENLYIKTCYEQDEITVTFGEWTGRYHNSEEGIDLLLNDIENIMNDDSYVWILNRGDKVVVGLVNDSMTLFPDIVRKGITIYYQDEGESFLDTSKMEQEFLFWNPKAVSPEPSLFLS